MLTSAEYTEDEWHSSAAHAPLQGRPEEDLVVLHRQWMWANHLRSALDERLKDPKEGPGGGDAMLVTAGFCFMFLWYGMLWSLVEACVDPREGRSIDIRGPFGEDIAYLSEPLRRFRNAIFHVPRKGDYVDDRMIALIGDMSVVARMRRIHIGFGRMFLEEFQRRNPAESG